VNENAQWLLREMDREMKKRIKEKKITDKRIRDLEKLNDELGKTVGPLKEQKDKIEKLMLLQEQTINDYKLKLASARMYLCSMLQDEKTVGKKEIFENFEKYDLDFIQEEDHITVRKIARQVSDLEPQDNPS
jgi:hypothetical protein